MTNPYYTPSGYPATRASGSSSSMRAELSSIASAFDKLPTLSGKANRVVQVNAAETGLEAVNSITLASLALTSGALLPGTWTPTLTNNTNVSASTAFECYYARFGNLAFCFGRVDADPIAASTLTRVDLSLPVASTFAASSNLRGGAVRSTSGGQYLSASIFASGSSAAMQFYNDTDVGNGSWSFWFGYVIL